MNKSNNSSTTDDTNEGDKQQEKSLQEEKVRVRKQINDLKALIKNIELELDVIPYGACKFVEKSSSHRDSLPANHIYQNIYHILQYEMHKLSGFYCSKVTESEFVVNISPVSSKKSLYVVQIFTANETVRLGGWVLPWGITIDEIIAQTPLQTPQHLIPFLRNCKRTVNCHANREEQFEQLKKSTSSINNIKIDATLGYITIFCHFIGMHNNSTKEKFDLILTLHYGTGRTQPISINAEWNLKKKISEELMHIKTFGKSFKTQPLMNAFEDIMKQTHALYHWKPEEYNDSILDVPSINFSSKNDLLTERSENESEENSSKNKQKRKKRRHLNKRNTKPSVHVQTIDTHSSQTPLEITSNSSEQEHNEVDLSIHTSDLKPQQEIPSYKNVSSSKKKKPNVNRKLVAKKNKLKPQQTELTFKGVPVNSRLTGNNKITKNKKMKIDGKKTATSTPKAKVYVARKNRTSMNSLGLSPIKITSTNSTISSLKK